MGLSYRERRRKLRIVSEFMGFEGPPDLLAHYLFQMYNNQQRLFSEFMGRDVMPLPIAELVGKVRKLFDYLIIATPCHDTASAEWRDAHWVRNIDPFLFGFLKQIPELMFFLGRWSGTGLFPLMGDMIADTIGHIKKTKSLLVNFDGRKFSWYKTESGSNPEIVTVGPRLRPIEDYKAAGVVQGRPSSEQTKWMRENHSLIRFADKLLRHFESGTVFSWLRGESR